MSDSFLPPLSEQPLGLGDVVPPEQLGQCVGGLSQDALRAQGVSDLALGRWVADALLGALRILADDRPLTRDEAKDVAHER